MQGNSATCREIPPEEFHQSQLPVAVIVVDAVGAYVILVQELNDILGEDCLQEIGPLDNGHSAAITMRHGTGPYEKAS